LDSRTGGEVLDLLRRSVDEFGQTVIMVTHDANAASIADRVVFLKDGRIELDEDRMTRDAIYDTIKNLEVTR
ncbi:MAG TPA: ABC transporter ATP-binding protein, partial [Thermoleophilia bacterium]|nr:ABC transporter ATP-binding protein [Thermoleophilia bacterium]